MTGFATSVIGCKCEAAIECDVPAAETPDGRPGVSVLLFATDTASLQTRLIERSARLLSRVRRRPASMGCPDATERLSIGRALRVFGDGFQASKVIGGRRYWRIPVMDGEFLVQEDFGRATAIGGGNFLVLGETAEARARGRRSRGRAMADMRGVILPFPGGIVRSGSKVGSKRYKKLVATTNDAFAPTLRPLTTSDLPHGVNVVYEIVLDGLDFSYDCNARCALASTPPAGPESGRSPPATTAASSAPPLLSPADLSRRTGAVTDTITLTLTTVARGADGCRRRDAGPSRYHVQSRDRRAPGLAVTRRGGGTVPRHVVHLGELFDIRGERALDVRVSGDLSTSDGLGAGMDERLVDDRRRCRT